MINPKVYQNWMTADSQTKTGRHLSIKASEKHRNLSVATSQIVSDHVYLHVLVDVENMSAELIGWATPETIFEHGVVKYFKGKEHYKEHYILNQKYLNPDLNEIP